MSIKIEGFENPIYRAEGKKNVWAVQWKALHSKICKVFSPNYFWKPELHSSIILAASLLPGFWELGGRILGGNGV